jgi:calcineurin-like phosphoesterase family protein
MQKCHHLGALALLGALTLYLILWPICCCAAKPTWSVEYKSQSNQTYLAAAVSSDNLSTNNTIADLIITSSGNNDSDTMVRIDNVNENVLKNNNESRQQPTTSIYELFALSKGKSKKKRASSDQILSRTDRSVHLNSSNSKNNSVSGAKRVKNNKAKSSTLDRNERSANLSHITGSARKIQLYIKNRFLQLLPDGTVNGTTEDSSDYSKFLR